MTIIVEVVTKTSIILSLTVILVAIFRRSSAAARYSIWLTGLCGALALPLVLYVVPNLSIPIPVAGKPTTVLLANPRVETIKSPEIDLPAQELPTSSALPETSSSTSSTPASLPVSWPTAIWLMGAFLIAARSTWSIFEIVKLRRGSRTVTESRLLELFSGLRRELSISANISLRIGSGSIPPMTWGVVRHTILLPEEAIGWTEERVRLVLTHELAHITRKDAAMQFVIYGACSIYWFNPLVWYAAKRMRIERECACDDQVLNIGVDAEGYATHLVEIARSAVLSRSLAVSMTHPSHFERRIRTLLDMRTNRRVFSRLGKSIMAGAAVMFVLVTASAHVTALPSSSLFLITAAPLVQTPAAEVAVTTKQTAPARNAPLKEDTTEISVGVSGQVTERIPSPWDYPRPDMFPGSIERSSKGVVFIPFAIYRDGYDTRISVKHLPVGTDSGMVRVGLYSQADSLHVAAPNLIIKTAGKKIGSGLKTDGTLAAGSTWTTTVSELLRAAAGPADFYGYMFIDTPFRDVEVDVHIVKPDGTQSSTPSMIIPFRGPSQPEAASPKTRLSFEVASIRPATAVRATAGAGLSRTPGGLTAHSTLRALVEAAYQTPRSDSGIGGTDLIDWTKVPESLSSQRYDIRAKASGRISGDQYWEMLQTLLEDRFKLSFHHETKELQIYALVLAKPGQSPGSKLNASKDADCPANPNVRDFCGVRIWPGFLNGQRVPITRIARELAAFAGRPVQNNTGLTGYFDFELRWTPDQSESKPGDGDKRKKATDPSGTSFFTAVQATDPSGPTFFTAVQEQLGLKLVSKKAPVEFIVIDHVEHPQN